MASDSRRTATSLTEQGMEQLELAEDAKRHASARRARISRDVTAELEQRQMSRRKQGLLTEGTIKATVDNRTSHDPLWKSKVSLNNWHMAQANMYFLAALAVGREEDRRPVGWQVDDEPAT